jgi:hypothetical protein
LAGGLEWQWLNLEIVGWGGKKSVVVRAKDLRPNLIHLKAESLKPVVKAE